MSRYKYVFSEERSVSAEVFDVLLAVRDTLRGSPCEVVTEQVRGRADFAVVRCPTVTMRKCQNTRVADQVGENSRLHMCLNFSNLPFLPFWSSRMRCIRH